MSDKGKSRKAGKNRAEGEPRRTVCPIVGIGASAGGLEACTALFKALPANLGMAYVFVPHLDPSRASALPEILGRVTSMPVIEAGDGTKVERNHVYVIPRDCEMTLDQGVLHLAQRDLPRRVNMAVDIFLRSLAGDQGSNAIGVILSGTASDGTFGMGAIKGNGGITFAQDGTAKYDGMPASAIAAGCVDMVLSPERIAEELTRIARHPYLFKGDVEPEAIGETRDAQMAQIFAMLRRASRVDFSEYKPPTIGRRIARRMALHKIEKLADYVTLLQRDRDEIHALYQDLLINVTSFFRDPEAFEALKTNVYPEMLKQHRDLPTPIRIWVPGCSSGEETYSHAISLVEFLGEERTEVAIQIFGTDLSESAVQRARAGIYKESIEADISSVRLRRFFHRADGGYQISKSIRDLCIFSTQNVFSDPPFSRIDLISCRNVMIYLGHSLQRRVVPVFHYSLNAGGFLMIGNTEGLFGSGTELFEMVERSQKIYRKKAVPTPMSFGFAVQTNEALSDRNSPNVMPPKPGEPARVTNDLQREADRLLLAQYAPPSVVVNEQLDIIQTKGHTGPYLELPTGRATLNLLKMARPGLLYELQNAIGETNKSGVKTTRSNVPVEGPEGISMANIQVTPFKTPVQDKFSFLITFDPASSPEMPAEVTTPLTDDERTVRDRHIAQLKQELAATKEYLQSIIEALESANEELQSANEEIQSGNEELQSTNEELQTSKEELESANEELHTVNEEMQHRNELLSQLNNDLSNLLSSVNLPMAMVGPDLSLRRFTPQAMKVLGLTASDIGRPMTRLKLNIEVENFERKLLDVMSEVRPSQTRVRASGGEWFDMRLTPYRTSDNRIEGVVLSLLNSDQADNGNPKNQLRTTAQVKKQRDRRKKK